MIIKIKVYTEDFSKAVDGFLNLDNMCFGVVMEHVVPDPRGGKSLKKDLHIRFVSLGGIRCDVPYDMSMLDRVCLADAHGSSIPKSDKAAAEYRD